MKAGKGIRAAEQTSGGGGGSGEGKYFFLLLMSKITKYRPRPA